MKRPPDGPSAPAAGAADWNVRDHLPLARLIIQGHRGVGHLAEENTVEAFELAWQLGLYPECDLRMTRDGVIVPFHDDTFARVVKDAPPALRRQGVQDLTYAELSQLDVGAWRGEQFAGRRVVPMARIFELMRGRPERHLYMDIKRIQFPVLAAAVREYGLERQVVMASSRLTEVRAWRQVLPGSETLLWLHGTEAQLRQRLAGLRRTRYADVTQLQIHVYPKESDDAWAPPADPSPADNPFRLRSAFLAEVGRELRAHGVVFQAFPYTADPAVYAQLLDLGVMSFATDHPDRALRALREYYAAAPGPAAG